MPSERASPPLSTAPEARLLSVLLALTAVTGLVDAVSFLALGRVFTANMTGNVALLGFALAGTPGLSVLRSAVALAAFLAGAVIGGRLAARMRVTARARWMTFAFGTEAAFLAVAAVATLGHVAEISGDAGRLYAAIVLTGLAMGVRNATVRTLAVPDMTTTVLTLTLTGLAADSALASGSGVGWGRRVASVAALSVGAAGGAWLIADSVALALVIGAAISGACALAATRFAKFERSTR